MDRNGATMAICGSPMIYFATTVNEAYIARDAMNPAAPTPDAVPQQEVVMCRVPP